MGQTYSPVQTVHTVRLEDVNKGAEHPPWAIWCASLKADLLGVSSSFRTSGGGPLPLLSSRLAFCHPKCSPKGLALVLRSKGCVTAAAKHDAEPPNQNG